MSRLETLFSLHGRRIAVTGASGGLGLAMSAMLAECGAQVFALSRTGGTKEQTQNLPDGIRFIKMDVTDAGSVRGTLGRIGRDGGLDVLINNAGVTLKKSAAEITEEEFSSVGDTNLKGVFLCCREAYPFLKTSPHGGRIINIASMASHLGFTEILPYCATKSAVLGITRALAVEWAPDGILVNSVSPGWFPSQMNRQVVDPARQKKILARMPLHRYGEPDELAPIVCFLSSPASGYITGQDFAVDGGALAYGF